MSLSNFFSISLLSMMTWMTVLIWWCGNNTNQNISLNTWDLALVDYIGSFEDGKVFDTSIADEAKRAGIYQEGRPYQPLPVKLWQGGVIAGFEKAIRTLSYTWQKVTVKLNPEEWYGPSDPQKIGQVPLEIFTKANLTPEVGVQYPFQNMQATVVAISGNMVTLDANHPMAGKVLQFEITLQGIEKNSAQ